MVGRLKKVLLVLLAVVLLAGAAQVQDALNRDRDLLGLTHAAPLENAPPVLAFTTVALGGFRGLISNALWMRATELQDQDKFFEMVQLADWITKLEPRFPHVWVVQAWNMAYNISVKFKDFADRWRWVQRGIELLRDQGLQYNPNDVLIHRELAWFFQHKMGDNLDDAHMHYKREWARLMAEVLGTNKVDLAELVDPKTEDAKRRASVLREKFKMDPELMKQLDERYGPLEWRLPEASAIYWAAVGLEKAKINPERVNKDDLIQLRRVIYQSMQLSFRRGKLIFNPFDGTVELGPNLDIIPKVNAAYEEQAAEDEKNRDVIKRAHRNFLRDAVYFLYAHARLKEAEQWFNYLATNYPNDNLIYGNTNSKPSQVTLDEYALARVQEDIGETSRDRVKTILEGFAYNQFRSLVLGEYERAEGFRLFATKIYQRYARDTADSGERIRIPPYEEIQKEVLNQLLDPERGWIPEARQRLRTELGLPPEREQARTNRIETGTAPR